MKSIDKVCNLSELEVGQVAIVLKINEKNKKIKKHLLDMGLTVNTYVSIKRIAPLGDPLIIALRDYKLCIGKKNLKNILVEVVK